ncbi:hypothetical protein CUC76_22680 [Enterobacteriaceae bacterium S05]|nr:hypothetical protein CUC76_22680 [Enterobacteriaceae bacterium S05]
MYTQESLEELSGEICTDSLELIIPFRAIMENLYNIDNLMLFLSDDKYLTHGHVNMHLIWPCNYLFFL